jgi:hypothetical protein
VAGEHDAPGIVEDGVVVVCRCAGHQAADVRDDLVLVAARRGDVHELERSVGQKIHGIIIA